MNPVLPLLAPIALLLPGVAGVELAREIPPAAEQVSADAEAFEPRVQHQVSIEQRITIRVAPRSPVAPSAFDSMPANGVSPRFSEKKMGKCVPVSGIVGVQYRDARRLVLYLRDRRMISATLEKSCSARDFYSGFYVARNDDGQLCVQRDAILSRSGANCQISGLKQLVEDDD
jgi:hypothetical protein